MSDRQLNVTVKEYFGAYARKDLNGLMAFWSSKSPEFESQRKKLDRFLTANESIEVHDLTVKVVELRADKARLRVTMDISATDLKTGKPAKDLGKTVRNLEYALEDARWKLWRDSDGFQDLAAALVATKDEAQRTAMLDLERDLVTPNLVHPLVQQGEEFRLRGEYTQAFDCYAMAESVARRLNDNRGLGEVLTSIGITHSERANYSLALRFLNESLEISKTLKNNLATARVLNNIGIVLYEQGEYDHALDVYHESYSMFDSLNALEGKAGVLNGMGNVYDSRGDYGRALDVYLRGLDIAKIADDVRLQGILRTNIGTSFLHRGDNAQALNYYQTSLEIAKTTDDKDGAAENLTNIGIVLTDQNQLPKAIESFQHGLELAKSMDEKSVMAYAHANLSLAYIRQGNLQQALEHANESLLLARDVKAPEAETQSLTDLAEIHWKRNNYAQALAFAEQASVLGRKLGSGETIWEAQTIAGKSHRALHHQDQALQAFQEAISTIESLRTRLSGGEVDTAHFFENKVSSYCYMVELLVEENRLGDALMVAERSKARVLLDVLNSGKINITKTMSSAEQEHETSLRNDLVFLNRSVANEESAAALDTSRLGELKMQLEKARLQYSDFQSTLYATHKELQTQRGEVLPISVEDAVQMLPDRSTAFLEFVVGEDSVELFVLARNSADSLDKDLSVYKTMIHREDLARKIAHFREQLAHRDLSFRAAALDLYNLLLKPAELQLRSKKALLIVPDGALWELPFQALQTTAKRYLLEDYALAYSPSLTTLRAMIRVRKTSEGVPSRQTPPTLLAMGNPAFGNQTPTRSKIVYRDEQLDPLPEAEREVKALGNLYGESAKVYVRSEATEDRFKEQAGKYRILHLATHGWLSDTSPMYSHLVLSRGTTTENDGFLEAWEIVKLDLKADLVVLSACETARGHVGAGEGIIGLTWAFFVAGAPTTVVSQWKVESDSTSAMMVAFHKNRLWAANSTGIPLSTARALQRAELQLLHNPKFSHPFYWAGFVVVGDPM